MNANLFARKIEMTKTEAKAAGKPNKECWKGLTYEYMESYISMVDEDGSLMKDFQCLRQGCNYAVVKKWFLTALPEINNFAA